MNWYKKTYVCSLCDALVEISTRSEILKDRSCFECNGSLTLLSVVDATILSNTTKKEETNMETLTPAKSATELLEENQTLIARLENVSKTRDMYVTENLKIGNQISNLKDYLVENYDELELHADEIATIMDVPLSREITYDVVINARVTVTVALGEDGEDIIKDNLYVDANYGDIVVDDYAVDSVSTY